MEPKEGANMGTIISVVIATMITAHVLLSGAAHATTHEFYKGKTIKIVVGFLAGDVYDLWARLTSSYRI
jgi:tripartite-type tricarboxylate transporter receptor subunit TctC